MPKPPPADNWVWKISRIIPSEPDEGRRVLCDVLGQLQAHDWVPDDIFGVHLALEEALVNAIKHGNQLDASKRVHIDCRMSSERLWIEIRDEGSGFDPHSVPDCTTPDNLAVPSGRGLMLMRAFMSRVRFNKEGNVVVMEKERARPT